MNKQQAEVAASCSSFAARRFPKTGGFRREMSEKSWCWLAPLLASLVGEVTEGSEGSGADLVALEISANDFFAHTKKRGRIKQNRSHKKKKVA